VGGDGWRGCLSSACTAECAKAAARRDSSASNGKPPPPTGCVLLAGSRRRGRLYCRARRRLVASGALAASLLHGGPCAPARHLYVLPRAIVVLIKRFQPARVVVTVGHEVHVNAPRAAAGGLRRRRRLALGRWRGPRHWGGRWRGPGPGPAPAAAARAGCMGGERCSVDARAPPPWRHGAAPGGEVQCHRRQGSEYAALWVDLRGTTSYISPAMATLPQISARDRPRGHRLRPSTSRSMPRCI
jgi:hypothetical protein